MRRTSAPAMRRAREPPAWLASLPRTGGVKKHIGGGPRGTLRRPVRARGPDSAFGYVGLSWHRKSVSVNTSIGETYRMSMGVDTAD